LVDSRGDEDMETTGARVLIEALVEQGVEVIFGYPGGAIIPTYDALHQVGNRLRHVLVRHEQGAAHGAQGYARATGRVGVCLVTSGPGATNLVTGLADARMDSTPLVCICGQVRGALLGTDAFQEADIIGVTLPVTKWSYQITRAEDIPWAVARAFEVASSGRPGPVVLDVTRDAQAAVPGTAAPPPHAGDSPAPASALDALALDRAAALIDGASRPYLLAGHGVTIAGAESVLVRLAEKTGMPVASTLLGLSAMPSDHRQFVGMLGMHGRYGANALTNEADVILAVGMRFDDRVTGRLEAYARAARLIHVDVDASAIGRRVPAEVGLVGDARMVLEALLPRVRARRHDDWLGDFRRHDREEHERVDAPLLEAPEGALRMAEVVEQVSRATRGEALLVTDVGQHQMVAARHYRFRRTSSQITSGGLGTMGFGLPAAVGAQIARPDRQVVALLGDGGFQMTLQELGTIMQERLAVKIVVLNNGRLGMVRQWQELFHDGRYSSVALDNPDFVAVCAGFRIPAERVESREHLPAAVDRLLAASGPRLLEAVVASQENIYPMMPPGASVAEMRLS
jgi:acetolactate synthase-1/2/3 large subunit